MTEAKKKRQYGVAANTPNRIVLPERHVIVLVGGTVDPTNFWEDINLPEDRHDTTHSRGYSQSGENKKDPKYWAAAANGARDTHDDNWYWETNPDFRDKLCLAARRSRRAEAAQAQARPATPVAPEINTGRAAAACRLRPQRARSASRYLSVIASPLRSAFASKPT